MNNLPFIVDLLRTTSEAWIGEDFSWIVLSDDTLKFYLNCNDIFYWGTADCEEVTPDNLPALKQTLRDLQHLDDSYAYIHGASLFCARVRGMRPQNRVFDYMDGDDALIKLFKECGPPREVGMGNADSKKGIV